MAHLLEGLCSFETCWDHMRDLERYPFATETTLSTKLEIRGVKFLGGFLGWGLGRKGKKRFEADELSLYAFFFSNNFLITNYSQVGISLVTHGKTPIGETSGTWFHIRRDCSPDKEPLEFNEGDVGIPGGIQAPCYWLFGEMFFFWVFV